MIFLLGLLTPAFTRAQNMDCEQTISYATEEFNAGHFYAVPAILNECLPRFNRDQRQRAHLLLTQTYLLLDDPIGAQRSYLEVLAANPEFVPDEKLHAIDVVYLSKRFTATPKFSWFVGGGSNVSPVRVIRDLEIVQGYSTTEQVKQTYSMRLGYGFGVGGEYSYDDNIRVRMEANFLQTSYHLEVSQHFNNDIRTFTDRQMWINVPLYVCYTDNIGKYRPYGYAGYALSHLFVDRASMTGQQLIGQDVQQGEEGGQARSIPSTSPDVDFLDRRNRLNQSIIAGGGVRVKVGLDFVFAEIRYSAGLKNIVNPDYDLGDPTVDPTSFESVASQEPAAYGHRDDYFRLDNLAVTIGFVRPLYKPRELKRARTGSVLRKMKRSK